MTFDPSAKHSANPSEQILAQARQEYQDAYEFDPRDPLFGLSKEDLRGPRMNRRAVLRLLAASGALTFSGVLASCAPSTPPVTSDEAAVEAVAGGELTCGWAGVSEIVTLDPATITFVLQFQITSNVLSGLTHINPDLVAEGDLAQDWSVSDDGLEWTFNLREGVTWHDGNPFTADDVLYTYNRSKDPEISLHTAVIGNVLDVEKVDDLTVKLLLEKPQASLLVKTLERASGRAMTMVSQAAIEEMGADAYSLMPVGTGPFRITEHQLGQSLVLEKFENYYDPERPKLDKITIIPIPEPEPLAAAIEAGDIQLIGGNSPAAELIDRFLGNPDLVVSEVPDPGFASVFINPWRDPFKVPDFNLSVEELKEQEGFKVRLALAKAFDRDAYIEKALFGRGVPALGSINPAMAYFFDTSINETSEQRFDLDAAQQLLADAGYPGGEGFPPIKLLTTPAARRPAEIIANMYQENLGITIELDIKDANVASEAGDSMDYDLTMRGSGGDYDPDDALIDWMQTSSKFNGVYRDVDAMPFGFFSDTEVDELSEQQRTETDLETRKELVQRANQITSDKVATIFTVHGTSIIVYHKDVNYPDESRIPGLVDLDRVTVSA